MSQKLIYILSCIMLATFLFGCRQKGGVVSVFDGLPESPYLTEAKASLENKRPLVVGFLAEWCPHCKKYKPTFFEAKSAYENNVTFIHVDVDDSNGSALSSRFQVKGVPTTVFVRADGSVFKVQVGGIEKEDLTKIVDELIQSKKKGRGEPIAPFPIELQEVKPSPKEEQPPQELIEKKEEEEKEIPEATPEVSPAQTPEGEELKEDSGRPQEPILEPIPSDTPKVAPGEAP